MSEERTPTQSPTQLLVRVEDAAKILSMGRSTVYEMIASGQLASVKFGATRRIPVAALHQWIAANTTGGPS